MKYFHSVCFDERSGTLFQGATPLPVTRKAIDVLRCLIADAGLLVSHDAIMRQVWPRTHVQPDNIKVLVRELRLALGDDPRVPRFIRTEPGRGYVFVAQVSDVSPSPVGMRESALSSIVGNRGAHLDRLAGLLADAVRGECRLAFIEGERGVGKTALCDAFLQRAADLPRVRLCYGQCPERRGAAEPWSPMLDALQHLARQYPAAVPSLLARHASGWLAKLPHWIAEAGSAPPPPAASVTPSRLLRELSAFFEALGATGTTVVVLDDMQWADRDSLAMIRAFGRRHAAVGTMMVVAYTPYSRTGTAAPLRSLAAELQPTGRCLPIALQPLSQADVQAYLAARFADDEIARLAGVLCRVTAGIPLLMVAACDALVAAGTIAAAGGAWHMLLSRRTIEASLPESVADVVRWWLDQLDPDSRALLEAAAAVGMEFSAEGVAIAAGGESVPHVARRLVTLAARGYVEVALSRSGAPGPSEVVFRFLDAVHADVLSAHAPMFQHLRAVERLTGSPRRRQRFG